MKLKILEETNNALFKRKEVVATVEATVTPKVTEVEEALSKHFSLPIENLKVKNVLGSFGSQVFKVNANVYESKEAKDQTEVKTKQEKEAEKKALEEAAAAKKAEEEAAKAAAEEPAPVTEETKPEEKTE